jgi:hypothetical protein
LAEANFLRVKAKVPEDALIDQQVKKSRSAAVKCGENNIILCSKSVLMFIPSSAKRNF